MHLLNSTTVWTTEFDNSLDDALSADEQNAVDSNDD
jgi:hypothetical protein